jgi:hypothetical protein
LFCAAAAPKPSQPLGSPPPPAAAAPPRACNALEGEDNPLANPISAADKNWAAEESETRFETESDMMELCDLAETL